MKKILFISGIQIFPPESGGQLRSANICRALSGLGHVVQIYSFTGRKADYINRKKSSEEKINENLTEYVNRNPFLGALQFLFYKSNIPPLWLTWMTKFYIPFRLKKKIQHCDSLLLDFPYLHPITTTTAAPVRVNTHNAEFELYPGRNFLSTLVKKIEVESFKKAEVVFFCNAHDEKKFTDSLSMISTKARILPNGVELNDFIFNKNDRLYVRNKYNIANDQHVFLFTASRYLPNTEAFEFLVEWSHKNVQFLIEENIVILVVGTVCETLYDSPYLKIAGRVPQIKPYFWASDFGLNPLLEGSGTNVKMIEFLAAKLPILTTSFGARGLKLVNLDTCFYFERSDLASVLKKAASSDCFEKKRIAEKAFRENLENIDISRALKALSINW